MIFSGMLSSEFRLTEDRGRLIHAREIPWGGACKRHEGLVALDRPTERNGICIPEKDKPRQRQKRFFYSMFYEMKCGHKS